MLRLLKNQKGAALASVIIATVVLMILGTAVLNVGLAETKLSVNNEEQIQAEYVAKSGADITAKYIMENPSTSTVSFSGTVGEGTYAATVTKSDSTTVKIVSTGTVNGVSKSVTLMLCGLTSQSLFNGIRQTGEDALDLSAMDITYEAGSTVLIEANVTDLDEITLDATAEADSNIQKALNNTIPPAFTVPDTSSFQTTLPASVGGTQTFVGNYVLDTLFKGNGDTLVFDTQGGDQHIVVNTLSFTGSKGSIIVEGGGNLHIYILDSGDIQTPVQINSSDPGTMFLYVSDGKTLSISANGVVNAYIYAPTATVEIQSDQTTINGAIVGEIINRGNVNGAKGNFHYVPLEEEPEDSPIDPGYYKAAYIN